MNDELRFEGDKVPLQDWQKAPDISDEEYAEKSKED